MEEKLDKILSELQNTKEIISNMKTSQKEMTSRMESLETGQEALIKGQKEVTTRMENLEAGQEALIKGHAELTNGQRELTYRMENLETGQAEIIDIIKHSTTLITENVTYVRKDLRTFQSDVNADIELFFNEVASVKRKVNKLEQSNK
ncbi:hypothetical protein [Neobacillus sp. SuZ13]|uniref:hypothetical protein n=1 Tax=Neobacillus sp. SuZ13 TaxID=3047875 RepID=UPI0024C01966|nr:hypothetical protein [Neobacillus sp. SuZ13]WHY64969.1 hypothetical protein QNH17_17825 [Neobacillus sp. SuZ13]